MTRRRPSGIWRDALRAMMFIAVVSVAKTLVEHTTFGEQLRIMSYNLLQSRLSADRVPVTIVDISDLEPERFEIDGRFGTATPREPIRRMIEAIVSHKPAALGIDIDFSPDDDGYIHPRDPEFFDFCLSLRERTGVPIFLGVGRALAKPASEWLGREKYQALAANILVPHDSSRMVHLISLVGQGSGRSMSVALADAYGRTPADGSWTSSLRSGLVWALTRAGIMREMAERRLASGLSVQDFLIDFSPLDSIEPLRTINPAVLADVSQRSRFEKRVVLLGDATLNRAADTFVVPGRTQPYPGVFLHASAAYTVIKAPLYEVVGTGRFIIDLSFSLAVLVPVLWVRSRYRTSRDQEAKAHALQGWLTLLIVVGAVLIGVLSVRLTRVMWDDFMLALAALVFHPSIEHTLQRGWTTLRQWFRSGTGVRR